MLDLFSKNKDTNEVWQIPFQLSYCTPAARKTFMSYLGIKSRLEFDMRRKYKYSKRIEGKNISNVWNTSDQVVITVSKELKGSLLVYPILKDEDDFFHDITISYCITETKDFHYKMPSYQQYAKSFGASKPNEMKLNPDIVYHICPMVKEEDTSGEFGLVLYYKNSKTEPTLSLAKEYENHLMIESEWDKTNSGGNQVGSVSFKKNPSFMLTFEDEDPELICSVMLSLPAEPSTKFEVISAQLHCGYFIFDERGGNLIEHTDWIDSSDVFKIYKLDTKTRKKFLIIPTTQNEGEESKFKLFVYSDHKFTLEKHK